MVSKSARMRWPASPKYSEFALRWPAIPKHRCCCSVSIVQCTTSTLLDINLPTKQPILTRKLVITQTIFDGCFGSSNSSHCFRACIAHCHWSHCPDSLAMSVGAFSALQNKYLFKSNVHSVISPHAIYL